MFSNTPAGTKRVRNNSRKTYPNVNKTANITTSLSRKTSHFLSSTNSHRLNNPSLPDLPINVSYAYGSPITPSLPLQPMDYINNDMTSALHSAKNRNSPHTKTDFSTQRTTPSPSPSPFSPSSSPPSIQSPLSSHSNFPTSTPISVSNPLDYRESSVTSINSMRTKNYNQLYDTPEAINRRKSLRSASKSKNNLFNSMSSLSNNINNKTNFLSPNSLSNSSSSSSPQNSAPNSPSNLSLKKQSNSFISPRGSRKFNSLLSSNELFVDLKPPHEYSSVDDQDSENEDEDEDEDENENENSNENMLTDDSSSISSYSDSSIDHKARLNSDFSDDDSSISDLEMTDDENNTDNQESDDEKNDQHDDQDNQDDQNDQNDDEDENTEELTNTSQIPSDDDSGQLEQSINSKHISHNFIYKFVKNLTFTILTFTSFLSNLIISPFTYISMKIKSIMKSSFTRLILLILLTTLLILHFNLLYYLQSITNINFRIPSIFDFHNYKSYHSHKPYQVPSTLPENSEEIFDRLSQIEKHLLDVDIQIENSLSKNTHIIDSIEDLSYKLSSLENDYLEINSKISELSNPDLIAKIALKEIKGYLPQSLVASKNPETGEISIIPEFWSYLHSLILSEYEELHASHSHDNQIDRTDDDTDFYSWSKFLQVNEQYLDNYIYGKWEDLSKTAEILSREEFFNLLHKELSKNTQIWSEQLDQIRQSIKDKYNKSGHDSSQKIISADPSAIESAIQSALQRYSSEVLGMPDYAMFTSGGRIETKYTSPTYRRKPNRSNAGFLTSKIKLILSKIGFGLSRESSPLIAIYPESHFGLCWPFAGSKGQLSIVLSENIYPTDISVEHVPAKNSYDISTAPKSIKLFAYISSEEDRKRTYEALGEFNYLDNNYNKDEDENEIESGNMMVSENNEKDNDEDSSVNKLDIPNTYVKLGEFTYNINSPSAIQTFPLPLMFRKLNIPIRKVIVAIESNWGNKEYTCIYRVRIHGYPTINITIPDSNESRKESLDNEADVGKNHNDNGRSHFSRSINIGFKKSSGEDSEAQMAIGEDEVV